MEAGRVAGEAFQVLEAAPVLDHRGPAEQQADPGAEQPPLGVARWRSIRGIAVYTGSRWSFQAGSAACR